MIIGIGVDIVDLARFDRQLARTPRLLERLFAERERALPSHSLAARFAAKEAMIKALGRSDGMRWVDVEVIADEHGNPGFALSGAIASVAVERGITTWHLTMTHDAGIACAFVVAEGLDPSAARSPHSAEGAA